MSRFFENSKFTLKQEEVDNMDKENDLKKDYDEIIREISDVLYPFYNKEIKKFGYIDKDGNLLTVKSHDSVKGYLFTYS